MRSTVQSWAASLKQWAVGKYQNRFDMIEQAIEAQEKKCGYVAAAFIVVCIVAAWCNLSDAIASSDIMVQRARTREIFDSSFSHLTRFEGLSEMNTGITEVLDHIEYSKASGDYDSLKRDLKTTVDLLDFAFASMELVGVTDAISTIKEHIDSLTDDDWANPSKHQAVIDFVYNNVSREAREKFNMSEALLIFTLEGQKNIADRAELAMHYAKKVSSDLRELDNLTTIIIKLVATDRLVGEFQLRLAKYVAHMTMGVIPAKHAMVASGVAIGAILGPYSLYALGLAEITHVHILRMQEEIDPLTLRESRFRVSGWEFTVRMLTGEGVSYFFVLAVMMCFTASGRNGAGIFGVVMTLLDNAVERMGNNRMWSSFLYKAVSGVRRTMSCIPYVSTVFAVAFITSNTFFMLIWYHDEDFINEVTAPLWPLFWSPSTWSIVLFSLAYMYYNTCIRDKMPLLARVVTHPSVATALANIGVSAMGWGAYLPDGYMQAGENATSALVAWMYSCLAPTPCILIGMCT